MDREYVKEWLSKPISMRTLYQMVNDVLWEELAPTARQNTSDVLAPGTGYGFEGQPTGGRMCAFDEPSPEEIYGDFGNPFGFGELHPDANLGGLDAILQPSALASAPQGANPRLGSFDDFRWMCNPDVASRRYRTFTIPKKSGGVRQISAPHWRHKNVLWCVNKMLQALYEPSPHAFGFIAGRSVKDNAAVHVGRRFILNIDLEDFFTNISQARVWGTLKSKCYGVNDKVAGMLAGLCCVAVKGKDGSVRHVLPQGAPTSPTLTNMVCTTLDRRLAGLAKRFGMRYTRYADDITFSSNTWVFAPEGNFFRELHRILDDQDFKINERKTRLQRTGERQEVTGLVVSDRVSISREYLRSLENLLYIWVRYGAEDAMAKMSDCEGRPKCRDVGEFINIVRGRVNWVGQIKGTDSGAYLKLRSRLDRVLFE